MKIRHLVCSALISSVLLLTSVKNSNANPVGGVVVADFVIKPGQTKYLDMLLRGRELTRVRVAGDGDGDIDCVVVSPRGNVVSSDRDGQDNCLLMVEPEETEEYRVIVRNNGERTSLASLRAD